MLPLKRNKFGLKPKKNILIDSHSNIIYKKEVINNELVGQNTSITSKETWSNKIQINKSSWTEFKKKD